MLFTPETMSRQGKAVIQAARFPMPVGFCRVRGADIIQNYFPNLRSNSLSEI
jgi:hypothetical protein